ncbi:hypothetical protein [Algiphilus aromaticivorans]|uniref:hypothetical protein n=1 Tax=Algiphilus aromaticivorans TaxID=382454 RepID=UPI0012EC6419|nr:hypothetical protein [Algiphilus aromaticivorans]
MIKHGVAAMLVALVGGFALAFSMLQGVSLSPIPVFLDVEIPGSTRGWRIFHIGMLMNGIMAIALAFALRAVTVTATGAALVSWGVIIAVWGNGMFYLFGMFAQNHGLSLHESPLGDPSLAGALAFIPAIVGAVALTVALIVLLLGERID